MFSSVIPGRQVSPLKNKKKKIGSEQEIKEGKITFLPRRGEILDEDCFY